MYKKNQGFGICGSRNIYSSKVRVDNWVEDNISLDLVKEPRHSQTLYRTVTREGFVDPTQMPEQPPLPVNLPSAFELKTKNKEGMPYSLLFEHNCKPVDSNDRFKSTAALTLMSRPENMKFAENSNKLSRTKSKQILDDINQCYVKSTESRYANAHLLYNPNHKIQDSEESERLGTVVLPNFKRYALLSKFLL